MSKQHFFGSVAQCGIYSDGGSHHFLIAAAVLFIT